MSKCPKLIALCLAVICIFSVIPQARAVKVESEKIMLQVTDKVWYEQTPMSPNVPQAPGLQVQLVAAQSRIGPTVVLCGVYHLGSPYMEYYGGQLVRAIRVVAVDVSTGQLYQSDLNSPDHPPIMLEANDTDAEQNPGWSTESGYFNVDVPALLGLPPRSGDYRVFLWLDDVVSNFYDVKIPANSDRVETPTLVKIANQKIQFGVEPTGKPSKSDAIDLNLVKQSDQPLVQATWNPVTSANPVHPLVWVLAMSHRDRQFAWLSLDGKEIPTSRTSVTFQLEVSNLLKTTSVQQKRFLLAVSVSSNSRVQIVRP